MVRRGFLGAIVGAVAMLLSACPSASAAFPGDNGKIAFAASPTGSLPLDVYSVNADGTALVRLTSDPADDRDAAWSPDGKRIAFATDRDGNYEIYVMNANGSGATRLTTDAATDGAPAWSPDGTKIAFHSNREGDFEIWAMNADGTDTAQLTTNNLNDYSPAWSPDGTRIAFSGESPSYTSNIIYVMQADGSGPTGLTIGCTFSAFFCGDSYPDWSPTQAKLAYTQNGEDPYSEEFIQYLRALHMDGSGTETWDWTYFCCSDYLQGESWSPDGSKVTWVDVDLHVSGVDGSNEQVVPTSLRSSYGGGRPSWQPLIHKEFPRPKGATPLRVSLVPAFRQCGSPNRTHGPPLASRSCNPTVPLSPNVSMGAPDWDGAGATFSGSARFNVMLGNPTTAADEADVQITTDMVDVRCTAAANALCGSANGSGAADYTRSLVGAVQLRITDEDNGPFPDPPAFTGPGTLQDTSIAWVIPCAPSTETTRGSTCSTATTADALVPGLVREKQRANWELGQMLVFDGGPDGDPSTAAGTEIFLTQGVFVP